MLACVAVAVAGAVVTFMATVVAARRERGIVAPRVGDAAPLQTAAVVPQSGRNSVSIREPYPRQYFPWWRFDLHLCACCHRRCAHWISAYHTLPDGAYTSLVVCYHCHNYLWPEHRPWVESRPDYTPFD